jgi:hypothetical protein
MKAVILVGIALLMFVPIALADIYITSDGTGTYVGGLPNLIPNGAYINSVPTITKDGYYVDGTRKSKYEHRKWNEIKSADSFKLLSSLKTHSK